MGAPRAQTEVGGRRSEIGRPSDFRPPTSGLRRPSAGLEAVANRKRHRGREEPVATVDRRIRRPAHVAERTTDDLTCQSPGPVRSLPAETKTPHVEVRVRNQGSVIFLWRRGLAKEIPGANEIAFAQLASDAELIEEARLPI